jgi:CheY-like chemotaxis protein
VETAGNGQMAVDLFTARPQAYDAVLLDLTMPGLSGDEALQQLLAIRTDLRVVLSSGFSESDALRRFSGQGLAGYLQKPYTAAVLARKIKQALRVAK